MLASITPSTQDAAAQQNITLCGTPRVIAVVRLVEVAPSPPPAAPPPIAQEEEGLTAEEITIISAAATAAAGSLAFLGFIGAGALAYIVIHRETRRRLKAQRMRKRGMAVKGGDTIDDIAATDWHGYAHGADHVEGDHIRDWNGHVQGDGHGEDHGRISRLLHSEEQHAEKVDAKHAEKEHKRELTRQKTGKPAMLKRQSTLSRLSTKAAHMCHHETAKEKRDRLRAETLARMRAGEQMHRNLEAHHNINIARWHAAFDFALRDYRAARNKMPFNTYAQKLADPSSDERDATSARNEIIREEMSHVTQKEIPPSHRGSQPVRLSREFTQTLLDNAFQLEYPALPAPEPSDPSRLSCQWTQSVLDGLVSSAGAGCATVTTGDSRGGVERPVASSTDVDEKPQETQVKTILVATALHAWNGDTNGHKGDFLTFPAGAKIRVLNQGIPGGWWDGKYEGKRGWFPSSFCKVVKVPLRQSSMKRVSKTASSRVSSSHEPPSIATKPLKPLPSPGKSSPRQTLSRSITAGVLEASLRKSVSGTAQSVAATKQAEPPVRPSETTVSMPVRLERSLSRSLAIDALNEGIRKSAGEQPATMEQHGPPSTRRRAKAAGSTSTRSAEFSDAVRV